MADQHPKTLGKYEVLSVIGRGGMGIVYKAKDLVIGRIVAVKTISTSQHDLGGDDDLLQRFQMEAQSAGRLQHPNIATLYDFGTHEDTSYIVMEFVDGTDLARVIDDATPLTLPQKLDIIIQVAHGLAYAHEFGVVHRDMKPSNVRLSHKGVAKIIDFGLARFDSTRLTKTGFMSGTIAYMSPERIHGDTGSSDDVWALGAIGWELLTYRRAFSGSTPPEVMMKIISSPPPAPSTIVKMPPELDAIVMKCLARDVNERYATAADYAEALEEFRVSPAWRDFLAREGIVSLTTRGGRSIPGAITLPGEHAAHPVTSERTPAPTEVGGSDPKQAAPTIVTATPATDIGTAAPTLVQASEARHSMPTLVEARPRKNAWLGAAAAVFIVIAGVVAMLLARDDAPIPVAQAPTQQTASHAVTGTPASTTVDAEAGAVVTSPAEIEVQRRMLVALARDLESIELEASEKGRLREARETAELAESKFGERNFEESSRLMTTAIETLRGLRQSHLKRVSSRPAVEPATPSRATTAAPKATPAVAVAEPIPTPEPVRAAPAPTPTSAPPPAREPAAPAREDTQREVSAFMGRVQHAYETKDVSFFRQHDANFSDKTEKAIRNSPSVRVEMKLNSIDLASPDRPRISIVRTDTFGTPNVPPGVQRLIYTLERSGNSWRIVAIDRQ